MADSVGVDGDLEALQPAPLSPSSSLLVTPFLELLEEVMEKSNV